MARRPPRQAPCVRSASSANVEQLGAKRHAGGSTGRTSSRYACTPSTRTSAPSRSARWCQLQGALDLGGRLGMGEGVGAGLGDDDDIDRRRQRVPTLPKDLAHVALQPIAGHGVPDPRAHGDTDTGLARSGGCPDHHEVGRMATPPLPLEKQEFTPPSETGALRVAGGRARHARRITPAASEGC